MNDRHLSWENLEALIVSGMPVRFPVPGPRKLEVMMEAGSSALSLLIPTDLRETLPITSLDAVQIERVTLDHHAYIRLVTRIRPLYREFYLLLTDIADSIQTGEEPLEVAINERLNNWRELLRLTFVLSTDRQLGLLGELWVLLRLIQTKGSGAVESWTGPLHEPHDFRFNNFELEVKSTRSRQRCHMINGLAQLQASQGLSLYLLSLQFEPASNGDTVTLPQMVSQIRSSLASDSTFTKLFDRLLAEGCSYRSIDELHYTTKYRLRSKPMFVPVDDSCPRLTRQGVVDLAGNEIARRIGDVRYTLNVDNLGFLDGTDAFCDILPEKTE